MKRFVVIDFPLQVPYLAKFFVLQLWPKMFSTNQTEGFVKVKDLKNELMYKIDFLYVDKHPQQE